MVIKEKLRESIKNVSTAKERARSAARVTLRGKTLRPDTKSEKKKWSAIKQQALKEQKEAEEAKKPKGRYRRVYNKRTNSFEKVWVIE